MRIAIAIVLGLVIGVGQSAYSQTQSSPDPRAADLSSPDSFGLECFRPFSIQRMRAVRPRDLRWELQMRSRLAWESEK